MMAFFAKKRLSGSANAYYCVPRGTNYYEARAAGFIALVYRARREGEWLWVVIDSEGGNAAVAPRNENLTNALHQCWDAMIETLSKIGKAE